MFEVFHVYDASCRLARACWPFEDREQIVAVLPLNVASQSLAAIMASDGRFPDAQTESKRVTWLFMAASCKALTLHRIDFVVMSSTSTHLYK
jgi:hypothetical protein